MSSTWTTTPASPKFIRLHRTRIHLYIKKWYHSLISKSPSTFQAYHSNWIKFGLEDRERERQDRDRKWESEGFSKRNAKLLRKEEQRQKLIDPCCYVENCQFLDAPSTTHRNS
jgi:hypothetical protein